MKEKILAAGLKLPQNRLDALLVQMLAKRINFMAKVDDPTYTASSSESTYDADGAHRGLVVAYRTARDAAKRAVHALREFVQRQGAGAGAALGEDDDAGASFWAKVKADAEAEGLEVPQTVKKVRALLADMSLKASIQVQDQDQGRDLLRRRGGPRRTGRGRCAAGAGGGVARGKRRCCCQRR